MRSLFRPSNVSRSPLKGRYAEMLLVIGENRKRAKRFASFPPPSTIGFALPIRANAPIGPGS